MPFVDTTGEPEQVIECPGRDGPLSVSPSQVRFFFMTNFRHRITWVTMAIVNPDRPYHWAQGPTDAEHNHSFGAAGNEPWPGWASPGELFMRCCHLGFANRSRFIETVALFARIDGCDWARGLLPMIEQAGSAFAPLEIFSPTEWQGKPVPERRQ